MVTRKKLRVSLGNRKRQEKQRRDRDEKRPYSENAVRPCN